MFVRLKEKPFYFLTDRDTHYTYLIDNRQPAPQRHLYYPEQWETMSSIQIRTSKWQLVYQLMQWSILNGSSMTVTDRKICHSKIFDFGFTLLTGLLMGSLLRRALFRIDMPFFDLAFQNSLFRPRWLKSMAAYSLSGVFIYNGLGRVMKEEYLVDLAL
jgi:hypothetical protein